MDNSFLHRKKLLLVDDEPDLLKMVSDILSDAGFETVLTAATVKEAIITAEKEKPDLPVSYVLVTVEISCVFVVSDRFIGI